MQTSSALLLARNRLVTAQVFYRMPDHRTILQEFIWQKPDLAPKFPGLEKFLDFWDRELDGPIHSVQITHVSLLDPRALRHLGADMEFRLH